ncbi:MAG: hypothetical protein AB1635_20105 [Acidobacteriota bacterium]
MRRGLLAALRIAIAGSAPAAADWPTGRGPLGVGVAPGSRPPVRWRATGRVRRKAVLGGVGEHRFAIGPAR